MAIYRCFVVSATCTRGSFQVAYFRGGAYLLIYVHMSDLALISRLGKLFSANGGEKGVRREGGVR